MARLALPRKIPVGYEDRVDAHGSDGYTEGPDQACSDRSTAHRRERGVLSAHTPAALPQSRSCSERGAVVCFFAAETQKLFSKLSLSPRFRTSTLPEEDFLCLLRRR